jgi:hypothetical protein
MQKQGESLNQKNQTEEDRMKTELEKLAQKWHEAAKALANEPEQRQVFEICASELDDYLNSHDVENRA